MWEDLDQAQQGIGCLQQLLKDIKNQMNCGDKDGKGVAHQVKRLKLE